MKTKGLQIATRAVGKVIKKINKRTHRLHISGCDMKTHQQLDPGPHELLKSSKKILHQQCSGCFFSNTVNKHLINEPTIYVNSKDDHLFTTAIVEIRAFISYVLGVTSHLVAGQQP
ncbi:hypothetical protein PoB_001054900 [Plakobranchus ocellatus]|uniref:Uncharacterized protein n=1 Tax=Plakobranchus ocellatus TaxID=259542 RepID=A0AAV3YLZ1_9GAST|nr:hypothetical protein PoB_001054900 [Plakobranchus ocellatus]